MCIWKKILKANDGLICETLANFFGQSKKNLYLYVKPTNGQNGLAGPVKYGYGIVLDKVYVDVACPIEIVKTILHESIHAEILRRLDTYKRHELDILFQI